MTRTLTCNATRWAVEFNSSRDGDSPLLPDLLAQIPSDQPVGTVTADGA